MRVSNKFFLVIIAISLLGCSKTAEPAAKRPDTGPAMQADYIVVRPREVANIISVTGTLLAAESAMVSAQTAGLITNILFKEGQRVSKGQVLVKLDDRQWVAQRQKLDAQLNSAERDLARKQQLLAIKGISQAEVDDAELLIASIKADKQELEVMIDFAVIRAPFSGLIGLRNVSPGTYLSTGGGVAQLVQTDVLKLEFSVPERYASQIKPGQTLEFTISGQATPFSATVYAVEPVINESTRALRVRANVPNSKGQLIAGAFTEVNLNLGNIPDALLVPSEAIVPQLNEQVVYKIANGFIQQAPVVSGIRLPRFVQIEQGLQAGDTIMVVGLLQAKDGMPVQAGKEIEIAIYDN